jgi:hypothetical protein
MSPKTAKTLKPPMLIAPQEGLIVLADGEPRRFRWSHAAIALYLSALPRGVKAHGLLQTQAALYAGCYYDALRRGEVWDMEYVAELLGEGETSGEITKQVWKLIRAAVGIVGDTPEQKKSVAESTNEPSTSAVSSSEPGETSA